MKILLIDDNLDILKLFTKVLSVKGYEIETATNGKDGLELIKRERWDLILLDIAMPQISGMDVIDDLEKNNSLKNNIIWLFTASSLSDEEVNNLKNRGIHDLITKPIEIAKLLAKIDKLKVK